jgi:two-component system sensor histidine kinase QseC
MTELDATRWRVFSLSDSESGLTVHVGVPYESRQDMAGQIAKRTLTFVLTALVIIGVLIWLGVTQALHPLDKLAAQVARRNPFDLAPIEHHQVPHETKPLIDALNNLFQRLDSAFYNERCFTSNAAHELRTPLAGIAAHNELALAATTAAQRNKALHQVREGVQHMSRLTQQLLTLARCDQPAEMAQITNVDLHALVSMLMPDLRRFARLRSIELTWCYHGEHWFPAIESAVEVLFRNVVDNAIRYTPQGGKVMIEMTQEPRQLTLLVGDSGPGIEPSQRLQVLQRFYRGENARADGSGLGLSIVQRCVQLHQGEIQLSTSALGGLQVYICLPWRTPGNVLHPTDGGEFKVNIA